jgi:hypothetical protein
MKYLWISIMIIILSNSIAKADGLAMEVLIFEKDVIQKLMKDLDKIDDLGSIKEFKYKATELALKQRFFEEKIQLDFIYNGITYILKGSRTKDNNIVYTIKGKKNAKLIIPGGTVPIDSKFKSIKTWKKDKVVVIFRQGNFLKK